MGVFTETRWTGSLGQESLTQAFGVDYSPTDRWTLGSKVEAGRVSDVLAGDLKRRALGLSAAYTYDKVKFASAIEYRRDISDQLQQASSDRTSWLSRNGVAYQVNAAWRLQAKANLARSTGSSISTASADFTELGLAAAYRPVNNDKLNTLFKFTYFSNVPPTSQLASASPNVLNTSSQAMLAADYSQRSKVLAMDTIYDLRPWLSVGAKFGYRWGALKSNKVSDSPWFDSSANLWVLRSDLHLTREWDASLEWRRLAAKEAGDARSGALLAVYRRVGDHFKVGAGYNFTNFSDSLTDMSYRYKGWFVNAISTF
jgi:hypothetical protein